MAEPFWRAKPLRALSTEQWESLCDGCGKCCLHKLENEDDGTIHYTNMACRLLDLHSCRCGHYSERQRWVPDCVVLNPDNIQSLRWMPKTCAYRLLAEGQDLPDWHPLISGHPDSVHQAGVSVRSWVISEQHTQHDIEDHIIDWSP